MKKKARWVSQSRDYYGVQYLARDNEGKVVPIRVELSETSQAVLAHDNNQRLKEQL